jgi:hypothetical protein
MVVGCGPCLVLGQWLCCIETRSVRGTTPVAVLLLILFRKCYKSRGCMVVKLCP